MDLNVRRWPAALGRGTVDLVRASLADDLTKLAASLTYFTVLSLGPALVVVVSVLGLVGVDPETLQDLLDSVGERTGSEWAVDLVAGVLDSVLASANTGVFLSVGVLASIWSASAYVNAFMWSADLIYRPAERRPVRWGLPLRLGLALLMLLLLAAAVAMVTLVGPLGAAIESALGLESGALKAWSGLSAPLLLPVALLMLTILHKYAPSRQQPAFWRLLAGAAVTLLLWFVASWGFSLYLANFGSYNEVYGALGAGVAFLVWAWTLNLAVLVGVEVNRAVEGAEQ